MPGYRRTSTDIVSKRVLVVDPGNFGPKIVNDVLGLEGYSVTLATDGDKAISSVMESEFDLVVMDLGTTRMEGAETVRRIRTLPEPKNRIPIVILSSLTSIESPTLSMHDADELLVRPISLDTLRDAAFRLTSRERISQDASPAA